ncbi:MAG: hypothetical protein RJA07_740 [Bacteroidota bacterium]|jgi:gliding motility-associated-like protein
MKKIVFLLALVFSLFYSNQSKAQLTAHFVAANGLTFPIDTCGNLVLTLNNTSIGSYDTAKWAIYYSAAYNCNSSGAATIYKFFGATKSSSPIIAAVNAGSYYVCLTVSNAAGQVSQSCACIANTHSVPIACFTASDTIGCGVLNTVLTPCNPNSVPPYTYTWNVGSGINPSTNTQYNSQYNTYGSAVLGTGSLNVKYNCGGNRNNVYLQVSDANGCKSAFIKTSYLYAVCKPTASMYVASGSNLCSPGIMNLASPAGNDSYTWWIPSTSTTATSGPLPSNTVSHNFTSFGCMNVKLAVFKYVHPTFGCSDTITQNNAVCIQGIANNPCLTLSTTNIGSGQFFTASFTACTNPASSSSIQGTLVAFPCNGSYPVGCVVPVTLGNITSLSCNSGVLNCMINLPACYLAPVTYCIGFKGDSITNLSNGCVGLYSLLSPCGGGSPLTITVNPCPSAAITMSPGYTGNYCSPSHQFCFDGPTQNVAPNLPGATYEWYVANPNSGASVQGTGVNFCTTFSGYGSHDVYLKVTQSAANGGCSTISTKTVSLTPLKGSFTYNRTNGCDTVTVSFTPSPTTDTLYTWDFGDGQSFATHDTLPTSHHYASNIDTCYTVKLMHRSYHLGGIHCIDTVVQYRIIHIGHKITPKVTLSDSTLCLKNGQACLYVQPDPITQVIHVPGSYVSLCNVKSCNWYFTRPHKTQVLARTFVCDTPKVCFTDTGVYSGHFIINSNGCQDTLTVDSLVTVNGIEANFSDSVWCAAGGVVTSQTCTFIPSIKIYPKNGTGTYPTTVKYILFGALAGGGDYIDSSVYWPTTSPNTPHSPKRLTFQFPNNGVYTVWMIVNNNGQSCQPDTVKKVVSILTYQAVMQLMPFNDPTSKCKVQGYAGWTLNGIYSTPNAPYPPYIKVKWGLPNGQGDTTYSVSGNSNTSGGLLNGFTHYYDSCGTFRVKLIIGNSSGSCQDSSDLLLTVTDFYRDSAIYHSPGFQYGMVQMDPVTGACNRCSKFTNKIKVCGSTLVKTTFNFQDGSPIDTVYGSTWTSFVHCFLKQPTTNIQYEVFSASGCSLTQGIATPTYCGNFANFSGLSDTVLCLGATLNLSNRSTGNVDTSTWTWDSIACKSPTPWLTLKKTTLANFQLQPQSPYTSKNGYYYLNLHVQNSCTANGGHPCSDDTCIRIHFQDPVAQFNIPSIWPCPSSFLPVTNLSYGAYDSLTIEEDIPGVQPFYFFYSKRQGGIPSSIQLPTGSVGVYNIICTIYSTRGVQANGLPCLSSVSKVVTVLGPSYVHLPPFKQHACINDTIWFNDSTNSANGILAVWNDATAPIQIPRINPTDTTTQYYHFGHPFDLPGKYPVYFFITDGSNCSYPIVDTVFIDGPKAAFTYSPPLTNFCGTANVQFQNSSIASQVSNIDTASFEWTLIDATTSLPIATYTSDTINLSITTSGVYSMKLKIKSTTGCIDSIQQDNIFTVHPKPTSAFSINQDSICINGCINFNNNSVDPEANLGYHWYFDWPNKSLTSSNPSTSYCFNTSGLYNAVLIDSSVTFCVDTSVVQSIYVSADVVANFSVLTTTYCGDSAIVAFTNLSTPAAELSYCWNFGDGFAGCQSNLPNPTHKFYLTAGSASTCFSIKLIVNNASGCDSFITKQICLYPKPNADFDMSPPGACNPLKVTFKDLSTTMALSPITNYYINWEPGSIYNSSNYPTGITHTYLHSGITQPFVDTVTYIITTQQGCMDTAIHTVNSYPFPIACVAKDTLVCAGQQVNLGCAPKANESYNWFIPFGTSYTPGRFNSNPYIQPQIDTTYCMQVSNQFGCSDTACVHVSIIPFIIPSAGVDTAICIGGSALLSAQGGITYSWLNQNTNQIISTNPALVVHPLFPATYTYTATINGTCNSDVVDVHVTVFPLPNVILNHEINDVVAGRPVRIAQVGAAGGFYTYLWDPNYHIDSIYSGSPTVWPDVTTKYTVILTDIHGCSDTADVTVHVLCNASNAVYVPNAFIPGSTPANSRFYVQGTGVTQLNYIRIYDRWGGLVYSAQNQPINDSSVGWDGFFNGSPMPAGVFMYQLEVQCAEGEVFPLTGTMTLIR